MLHATKSHTPFMLIHLPGGQATGTAEEVEQTLSGPGEVDVGGVWWNSALSGSSGILGGMMELRREILAGSGVNEVTGDAQIKVRYRLYHNGRRFDRLGPALESMEDDA